MSAVKLATGKGISNVIFTTGRSSISSINDEEIDIKVLLLVVARVDSLLMISSSSLDISTTIIGPFTELDFPLSSVCSTGISSSSSEFNIVIAV